MIDVFNVWRLKLQNWRFEEEVNGFLTRFGAKNKIKLIYTVIIIKTLF